MKKYLYSLSVLGFAILLVSCSSDPKKIEAAKKLGYDSARKTVFDSLAKHEALMQLGLKNFKEKQLMVYGSGVLKHSPPNDGHVHDGGYSVTTKFGSKDYATGIMDRVIDKDHNQVVATLPFIVKKGQINQGDDYLSDKKKHAHLKEYEIVEIPELDSTGHPTSKTYLLAIVKKVLPK